MIERAASQEEIANQKVGRRTLVGWGPRRVGMGNCKDQGRKEGRRVWGVVMVYGEENVGGLGRGSGSSGRG